MLKQGVAPKHRRSVAGAAATTAATPTTTAARAFCAGQVHGEINHHVFAIALLIGQADLLAVALLDLPQQRQRIMIIHKAHGFTMAERFQRAKNGCVAKALGDATRVEQMNLRGLHAGFSGKHRGHCAMTEPLAALSADKNFPTVLVVYASQSGRTARLAQAAADGARQAEPGARVWLRPALEARVEDLLAADALLLATPENFGYMAGALKDFFDRTYYPAQGRCQGLPYAVMVCAGNDGRGAIAAIERIAIGYGWRAVAPPLRVLGEPDAQALADAAELGGGLAAGVALGIC